MESKKKYFHDTYFKKILVLFEENRLEEAIREFHNYIELYPNDLCGYVYYADSYIKMGHFQEAERILAQALITNGTSQLSKDELLLVKIKLLCCQEKYQECFDLLSKNRDVFQRHNWGFFATLVFLKKKLGILQPNDYVHFKENYLCNQIVSYNEKTAISHINKHMACNDNIQNDPVQFVPDFPFYDIYYQLRNMLPLATKIYYDITTNLYIFKYDANGHVNSKLVDYFAVITLKDSNDIITMYPYENKGIRDCVDLTPTLTDHFSKIKRISQIDKFNQRYGKMVDKK